MDNVFPIGAHVLVDGRDDAWIKAAWPEGNTTSLFPHYVVVFERSPFAERVSVSMKRVGVEKAP